MKILYWNARGLGNLPTRLVLKKLCDSHKPDFLFLAKLWIAFDQFPSTFWKKMGLKLFAVNNREPTIPNLWGLCADHIFPTVIATSQQHISLSFKGDSKDMFVSAVYAYTTHTLRRQLWLELASL